MKGGPFVQQPPWIKPVAAWLFGMSLLASTYLCVLITQVLCGTRTHRSSARCNTLRMVCALVAVDAVLVGRYLIFILADVHLTAGMACDVTGVVTQFVATAHALLHMAIALDVFRSVRDPLCYKPDAWCRRYVGGALGAALLTALAPLFVPGAYSPSGNFEWCWLREDMAWLFYALLFSSWGWCAFVVGYFAAKKRRAVRKGRLQALDVRRRLLRRMAIFGGLFVITWLPSVTTRACIWAGAQISGRATVAVDYLMLATIGIVEALVWYGPVCAQAARRRVPVASLAAVRAWWQRRRRWQLEVEMTSGVGTTPAESKAGSGSTHAVTNPVRGDSMHEFTNPGSDNAGGAREIRATTELSNKDTLEIK